MNERRDEILERLKRIEEILKTHVDKPMEKHGRQISSC